MPMSTTNRAPKSCESITVHHTSVTNLSFNSLKYAYGIEDDPNAEVYQGLFNLSMAAAAGIAALSSSSILKLMGRR